MLGELAGEGYLQGNSRGHQRHRKVLLIGDALLVAIQCGGVTKQEGSWWVTRGEISQRLQHIQIKLFQFNYFSLPCHDFQSQKGLVKKRNYTGKFIYFWQIIGCVNNPLPLDPLPLQVCNKKDKQCIQNFMFCQKLYKCLNCFFINLA